MSRLLLFVFTGVLLLSCSSSEKPMLNEEASDQSQKQSKPLSLDEYMANFPKKWYPLAEVDGKLKRQQLCGAESFIEITHPKQFVWREQSFDNVWEAPIDGFTQYEDGSYLLRLQLSDGGKKEMNFLPKPGVEFVYTLDGRTYTPKPEQFEISNDKSECL